MNTEEIDKNTVTVKNVSKSFLSIANRAFIQVLKDISFIAEPGQITALMGDNGSGKSTLLRLISGLIKPSGGKIYVLGELSTSNKIKKTIGFLPENPQFHRGISGLDFLSYLARLKGLTMPSLRAKTWLENFGIEEKWQHLPTNIYSEGMRERVGLAGAFMNQESKILLLDEPLENLDKEMKAKTIKMISEASKIQKKIVITAIHPDSDFEKVIDKKYLIQKGRIV